jgi:hypothetical protein
MLNRTLSANLNRLNLGTRSLALMLNARGLNGNLTPSVRLAHGFALRAVMFDDLHPPIRPRVEVPGITDSAPAGVWPVIGHAVRSPVGVARTVVVSPEQRQSQPARSYPDCARPGRKAFKGKRPGRWDAAGAAAERAAIEPVTATAAGTGG